MVLNRLEYMNRLMHLYSSTFLPVFSLILLENYYIRGRTRYETTRHGLIFIEVLSLHACFFKVRRKMFLPTIQKPEVSILTGIALFL